jgi:tetratricopeptide (TPR) repeat protein
MATAYTHRGRAWTEQNEFDKALADCEQALALDPKSNVAHYYRGRALARQRRSDEAIADFTRAIQLHPGYVPALNDRGIEYVRRRQYARAIEDFDAAIMANPRFDRVQIHYNRGNAWFALGKHRRALADYRVSLRHDAGYQPALVAMAACYAHQGNFEDAIEWQQKAVEVAGGRDRSELLATLDRYALRQADGWPSDDVQSP